ncbi:MAG TPA: GNAT family N-acetyltransferase [Candidatus Limnocylindrales bacterium]|nr:GNAT family N-acetyltransferase [Candidatus Limnocylindrales bacterium]
MRTAPGTGRPADIDAPQARWLAWHEAQTHGLIGREVRELGDGVLLHDQSDREPFWNRLAGIAWPAAPDAFDRRLAEAIAMFGVLDRIPHVWPSPGFDEPPDLVARLEANGFDDMGAGLLMALDVDLFRPGARSDGRAGTIAIHRFHHVAGEVAARAARDVASVLSDAFAVDPDRRAAIEEETVVLLGREEFHVCLVTVDGEPAAAARRTTFAGASYLSSIGTRPAFRGRGLGRVVTEAVARDAVAAGSRWTYLGVFSDNAVAKRLYEGLGFRMIGEPAPDLLLRS